MDAIMDNGLFSQAVEYAIENISRLTKFRHFVVALIDRFGVDICPLCKSIYASIEFMPGLERLTFEDVRMFSNTSEEEMMEWYHSYVEYQERKHREDEIKKGIDELTMLVKQYRNSDAFKKMLDFVGRFPYFAPYNAMLLYLQKPGTSFVLTARQWRDYNRQIKPNAQNIIMLIPFGPTYVLHDIEDTEQIPGLPVNEDTEIMENWEQGLKKTSGELDPKEIALLIRNLSVYGILLDDKFKASQSYGGYIGPYTAGTVEIPLKNDAAMKTQSRFLISVNSSQTEAVKFHTICHELGHLFCQHLYYTPDKERHLSTKEEEFEAETVAWLVCKRRNIDNPSEEYLATYASHGEIPFCSPDAIMAAVTAIERMLTEKISIKESPWYKNVSEIKSLVDRELIRIKSDKHGQMNLFGEVTEPKRKR